MNKMEETKLLLRLDSFEEFGQKLKKADFTKKLKRVKQNRPVLNFIDSLLAAFVVGPLVIIFYRGTWEYLILHTDIFPLEAVFLFSVALQVSFALLREPLQEFYITKREESLRNKITASLLRTVYVYVFAVACVMQWRSLWDMCDFYLEVDTNPRGSVIGGNVQYEYILAVVSVIILAYTKTIINFMDSPYCIDLDCPKDAYNYPTRFKTRMAQKTSLYILDCLFSVLIVGTLVVFVWRGAWALVDILLFPEDEYLSAFGSLVLGYGTVLVSFLLQTPMRWLCDRLTGGLRLLAADIFLCFSLLGTVNVWRGIWNLLNLYFLPDNLELSCWITHWVSLVLLILMGCSNSLLVRGVYIDAEEPAGKCVIFPCYYLRLIFQQEREKKNAKKMQLDVMAKRKQELDLSISGKISEANHIANINQFTEPNHHAEV